MIFFGTRKSFAFLRKQKMLMLGWGRAGSFAFFAPHSRVRVKNSVCAIFRGSGGGREKKASEAALKFMYFSMLFNSV